MRTVEPSTRILLVEDESGHAELIRRAFEDTEKPYDVVVATTIAEARELASRYMPHLALVDYTLPDGPGDVVIGLGRDVFPVIMLTSHSDEQLAVAAIKSGALDYVAKSPELFSTLPHVVERALREWQLLKEGKKGELALRRSEDQFKELFDDAPVGYHEIDDQGMIIRINNTELQMLGYMREELLGMPVWMLSADPDNSHHAVIAKLQGPAATPKPFERNFRRKDGKILTILIEDKILRRDDGSVSGIRSIIQDISELKQAEEALYRSEVKFRTIWDNSADGMRLTDHAGRIVDVNEAFCSLVKLPRGQLLGKVLSVAYQSQGPDDTLDKYHQRFEKGEVFATHSGRAMLWNGEEIFLDVSSSFIEPDGHERLLLCIFRDVTEQYRAQEALLQKETYLRGTLDSTGDGILSVDGNGRIINVNHRFNEMWHIPESLSQQGDDHALLTYVLDQLSDPDAFIAKVHDLYHSDRIDNDLLHFKDGRIFERHSRPLTLGESVVGRVWSFRDITIRMQAEEALHESEQNFRTLADSGRALVWTAGTDKLCNWFNRTWLEFTGRTLEQEYGNGWAEGVHQDDLQSCLATYVDAFDQRVPFSMEYRLRRYDGEFRWVLDDGSPRYDSKGAFIGYIGHCLDITDRKHAEQARKSTEEALRHAQKLESIGTLAGGIAHDFNNLLNAIMGQSSLALEKLPPDNPAALHVVKSVRAAERAADLTRQLLAYSGKGKFITEEFDLNTMVEDNAQLLKVSVPKTATVRCTTSDVPLYIHGDAGQIQQVIMNLIINAGESMGSRPGTILIRTSLLQLTSNDSRYWKYTNQPLPTGDYALLEVSDNGGGIAKDVLARIFDPFFSTKFTGRGLGLAAVLGIVRGHQGGISIVSEIGKGSQFQVVLPANEGRVPATIAPRLRSTTTDGGGKTVLVIDDEPLVLELLTDIFAESKFSVLGALNPLEGLEQYRKHFRDIAMVILDYSMPGMDGRETFKELLKINNQVKVLLCSGYTEDEVELAFGEVRPIGFVHKPYKPSDLLDRVLKAL